MKAENRALDCRITGGRNGCGWHVLFSLLGFLLALSVVVIIANMKEAKKEKVG